MLKFYSDIIDTAPMSTSGTSHLIRPLQISQIAPISVKVFCASLSSSPSVLLTVRIFITPDSSSSRCNTTSAGGVDNLFAVEWPHTSSVEPKIPAFENGADFTRLRDWTITHLKFPISAVFNLFCKYSSFTDAGCSSYIGYEGPYFDIELCSSQSTKP